MRGIRGWIINLLDGLAPPPATVQVRATSESTNTNLDVVQHGLGRLDYVHVQGGAISPSVADNIGHFGWDMELSPGLIDVSVNPTDPQNEYRRRFPDESSQIGKAFLTDLERVGWAGGRSGLVWGAVVNSGELTNIFEWDFTLSWSQGNGSIARFGIGADAGRFVIRRFMAILGGVPFSVEMNDLMVPIAGQPPAPPNAGGADRWDLYCIAMHDEPGSALHGKQSFELFQGSPGGGIPAYPIPSGNTRRLPLHILKMPSGGSSYTDAVDVRVWLNAPSSIRTDFPTYWVGGADQDISNASFNAIRVESTLNAFAPYWQQLPLTNSWNGFISWDGWVDWEEAAPESSSLYIDAIMRGHRPDGTYIPSAPLSAIAFNLTGGDNDYAFAGMLQHLAGSSGTVGRHASRMHANWVVFVPNWFSEGAVLDPPDTGFHKNRDWTNFRIDIMFEVRALSHCRVRNQKIHFHLFPDT